MTAKNGHLTGGSGEQGSGTGGKSGCLTKADIADSIYDNLPFDKHKATQIVEEWIEFLKDGLIRDEKVMLSGFGVFEVKGKHPRPGRNPQTGDRIILSGRNVVKFKPSQILRRQLNDGIDVGGGDDDGDDQLSDKG